MIFKPKIKKVLQYLTISAIALTVALSINTLQAHAAPNQAELNVFLGKSSSAESTGGGSTGGKDTIKYGVGRSRTGYMAYLLTTDGQPASSKAVAFKSPGFSYYPGDVTWYAKSRLGNYTVSDFKGGFAPWNLTPWEGDGTPTNEPSIKAYMLTVEDGVENTLSFINKYFSKDDAIAYGKKEAILVIETLMHFQFSRPGNSTDTNIIANKEELLDDLYQKERVIATQIKMLTQNNKLTKKTEMLLESYGFIKTLAAINKASTSDDEKAEYLIDCLESIQQATQDRIAEVESMEEAGAGGRIMLGTPLVGTVPELIKVKEGYTPQPGVFDSYINDVACVAEYMTAGGLGEQAGFRPWDGSTRSGSTKNGKVLLSNKQVKDLAVAMMVFTAQTDNQTTADEPKIPTPHAAPKESEGTFSIVKSYRTKNNNNLQDDGTFSIQNIGSDITIESEGKYQVVNWAITNQTSTSISSINWNPPGSIQAEGTTPSSTKITDPYKCLYVLLEKLETPEPEAPADYNYKLTESTITRRVLFSEPDNRLQNMNDTSEKIESQTFKWIAPAHKTSCPGDHVFTAACEGEHVGEHTASCPKACPATCTQEHPTGSHIEGCDDPHYYDCGKRCEEQKASCIYGEWHERHLKLSINNIKQNDYKDVLVTKQGWNAEVSIGHITKHFYLNDAPFERESTNATPYEESNWDYVCVLLRGKDKLTVAQWENAGEGSGIRTNANTDFNINLKNEITEHHQMSCYGLSHQQFNSSIPIQF